MISLLFLCLLGAVTALPTPAENPAGAAGADCESQRNQLAKLIQQKCSLFRISRAHTVLLQQKAQKLDCSQVRGELKLMSTELGQAVEGPPVNAAAAGAAGADCKSQRNQLAKLIQQKCLLLGIDRAHAVQHLQEAQKLNCSQVRWGVKSMSAELGQAVEGPFGPPVYAGAAGAAGADCEPQLNQLAKLAEQKCLRQPKLKLLAKLGENQCLVFGRLRAHIAQRLQKATRPDCSVVIGEVKKMFAKLAQAFEGPFGPPVYAAGNLQLQQAQREQEKEHQPQQRVKHPRMPHHPHQERQRQANNQHESQEEAARQPKRNEEHNERQHEGQEEQRENQHEGLESHVNEVLNRLLPQQEKQALINTLADAVIQKVLVILDKIVHPKRTPTAANGEDKEQMHANGRISSSFETSGQPSNGQSEEPGNRQRMQSNENTSSSSSDSSSESSESSDSTSSDDQPQDAKSEQRQEQQ